MTSDVILALQIAEEYLQKGDWIRIRHDKVTRPVWLDIGTIHTNGKHEQHYITYKIRGGVATKHVGL